MGVGVLKYNIPIYGFNQIWVDPTYGDDATAEVDRIDAPFATFEAAWNARRASSTAAAVINVANGTYTVNSRLLVSSGDTTVINCESRRNCILNYVGNQAFFDGQNGGSGSRRSVVIIGGTWNRVGTANGFDMFYGVSNNIVLYYIYDADINDLVGTTGMFYSSSLALLKNCRAISTVGNVLRGSTGNNPIDRCRIEDSYCEATSDKIFEDSPRSQVTIIRSKLVSLTSWFFGTLINNGLVVVDSTITQFNCPSAGKGRGTTWVFNGVSKLEVTSSGPALRTESQTYNGFVRNHGSFVLANGTNTGRVWVHTGAQGRRWLNGGRFIYQQGQKPFEGSNNPAGLIGIRLNSSTPGNIINMDCVANNGSLWNRDRLVYNITSSNILDTLNGMKAQIENRITTEGPGNPWWEFTKGDLSNIFLGANNTDLYVRAAPNAALGYQISATTKYFNGPDTGIDLNALPDGLVDGAGGHINEIANQPLKYGGTERLVDRMEAVRTYRNN